MSLLMIPIWMVVSIFAGKALDRFLARYGWSHADHVRNRNAALYYAGCDWVCDTFEAEGGTSYSLRQLRKFVADHRSRDRDLFWRGMVEGIKVIEQTSKLRRL